MAEENLEIHTPESDPIADEVQLSPVEQRAMEQGWVPQEEWAGDPDDWRPAKEFIDRGELFKRIEEQKRELKQLKTAMSEFGKHHAEVKKLAYKQALEDLRARKKEALESGDADAVIQIDDRIAETREAQKVAENTPAVTDNPAPQPDPEFVQWQARNQWYHTDRAMKLYADDVAVELFQRGISDPATILKEVDRQIRQKFKSEFENPNREKPGPVEGKGKPPRKSGDDSIAMSDAEKRIMKRIIDTGAITKEKYLEEFKARQGG